jgi:enamine deaminase RidA (YjgF/YER057c/UK114 family)
MQTVYELARGVKCSTFSTSCGNSEYYLTLRSSEGHSFKEALEELSGWYTEVLLENGLDETTIQFTRFYLSDIVNDYNCLEKSELYSMVKNGAVSCIEQSPVAAGQLAMLVYHIKASDGSFFKKTSFSTKKIFTEIENYSFLWNAGSCTKIYPDSAMQTLRIFSDLCLDLRKHNMNLRDNTVRTWIYVKDVDNNYTGMVNARRELFNIVGLTSDFRYIASTGIEGNAVDPGFLVSVDSLSIGKIQEEQIVRMEALQNLNSTIQYGVTFERGTRIRFGDRSHLYISGTASIDNKGNILYSSDILKQTERTIENIKALLSPHGASLKDMQYMIIYLRNPKHFPIIKDLLAKLIPENVAVIPVEGPVCRPGWLIEMEGVAIIPDDADYPPFL